MNITDEQIIDAIKQKKEQLLKLLNLDTVEDTWTFNHVMTVLEHTIQIFKMNPGEISGAVETFQEIEDKLFQEIESDHEEPVDADIISEELDEQQPDLNDA